MIKPDDGLYSCDQIRACEHQAFESYHLNEMSLMSQAGAQAFQFIKKKYPTMRRLAVFCGKGNNAGDGYVLAKRAHEEGLSVIVYQCSVLADLTSTAREAALLAIEAGVECQSAEEPIESDIELLVDALLGTGLKGPVQGLIAAAISQMNSSGIPVLSLDLPSGLQADTGKVENLCVKAKATVTFIALKPGMFTLDGPDHCGEIERCSLQLENCVANLIPYATLLNCDSYTPFVPRKKNSHKGCYGHVLIIGGGPGMPGAVALTAKAVLRTGAGMVTVATLPSHVNAVLPFVPEAMVFAVKTQEELKPLLAKATVCVIGPGLGSCSWAKSLFLSAITSQLPMVIDASALHLLAKYPQVDDNWVLTPHPGEAASLLSSSTYDIQANRFEAAKNIQDQYGGIVVLKGIGTIVQTHEKGPFVCPRGNPGMSSAGMGDVLSGIIAGLLAQGFSLSEAAKFGVFVHAKAGDALATQRGEIGLLASDLIERIPVVLNDR